MGYDQACHDHAAGGDDQMPVTAPDAASFATRMKGSSGAAALTATDLGWVEFTALNHLGVTVDAELAHDGNRLTVQVVADGLEPGQTHIQHIHGRIAEDGTAVDSNTPSPASDQDGDGFVELLPLLVVIGRCTPRPSGEHNR